MAQPIKRFIDVEITKENPLVSVAGFNKLLCLTEDTVNLPTATRILVTTTKQEAYDTFGSTSEEYLAASAFFDQDPELVNQPETLIFGSYDSAAETEEECLVAIEELNNDWAAMCAVKSLRDVADTNAFADAIETRNKIFVIATNDAQTLVSADETHFAFYLKDNNYKRTAAIYHDQAADYPDMSWLGQQLPKDVGSTNWAYKTLYGQDPVELTESQKNIALGNNCNLYTTTLGADFTYFGTMGGGRNVDKDGEYIDIIRNIDFLNARVGEGMMSLLLENDIIYMTNAGITKCENRLRNLLDFYGVKQSILIEDSIVITAPKRSEISQTDRDDRKLPDLNFTAELTGGINTVVIRGRVTI